MSGARERKDLTPEEALWYDVEAALGHLISEKRRGELLDRYGWPVVKKVLELLPTYLKDLQTWPNSHEVVDEFFKEQTGQQAPPPSEEDSVAVEVAGLLEAKTVHVDDSEPQVYWLEAYPELPNLVRALIENILSGTNWVLPFALASALALVGASLGNNLRIHSWGGVMSYPNDYFLLVAPSRSGYKSKVLARTAQIAGQVNPAMLGPQSGSWRGLLGQLQETPAVIWCPDEWARVLREIKGQDWQATLADILCSLHDWGGVWAHRLRKASDSCRADNPALTLISTIQTSILAETMLTRTAIKSGFVNRFLFFTGESPEDRWPSLEWDVWTTQASRCVRKLRELQQANASVYAEPILDIVAQWDGKAKAIFGPAGPIVAERSAVHNLKIAHILWAADVGVPENRTRCPERYGEMACALTEAIFRRAAELVEGHQVKVTGEITRKEILEFLAEQPDHTATRAEMAEFCQLPDQALDAHLGSLVTRKRIQRDADEAQNEIYFLRE